MSGKILISDTREFKVECVERKITISKGTSGTINGSLRIPMKLLELIGVTENNRVVTIDLKDDKLIVENFNKKRKLIKEDWIEVTQLIKEDLVEVTQEEKRYLLIDKSKDTFVKYIKKKIHNLFSKRAL